MSELSCPICGSSKAIQNEEFSNILNLVGNSKCRVQVCECGLKYLHPYISDLELESLYGESYFTGFDVVGDTISTELKPSSNENYDDFAELRSPKFDKVLDKMIMLNPNAKNVLDIGAATGVFLSKSRKRGLKVSGVELSEYAANKAKKRYDIDLFVGRIEEFNVDGKFDLIHLNHVLEHFTNPLDVVNRLSCLLSDGGVIYVEVPYQFNIVERSKYFLTGRKKDFNIFSLHHALFFDPYTLVALFEKYNFTCEDLSVYRSEGGGNRTYLYRLKRVAWHILSFAKQGLFIEAYFRKCEC